MTLRETPDDSLAFAKSLQLHMPHPPVGDAAWGAETHPSVVIGELVALVDDGAAAEPCRLTEPVRERSNMTGQPENRPTTGDTLRVAPTPLPALRQMGEPAGGGNPYDQLAYRSLPIAWTAPERLALTSWLHGGPVPPLSGYRVLELGSADGANLLPLAWYRRHAHFVGIDGAVSQVELARARADRLCLSNVEFIAADFEHASNELTGTFDYIIAHGVFSWVTEPARDALLALCAARLRPGGLVYINYNTRPGWNVRGMIRDFLLGQSATMTGSLRERAERACSVAAEVCASMEDIEHPYSQLLTNEFRFVRDSDPSYVAHEFLAAENHAYWRSEFMTLAQAHSLECIADADFNYQSGRVCDGLASGLANAGIGGSSIEDTIDFLCYRQLHSPILARVGTSRVRPKAASLGALWIASCLTPCDGGLSGSAMFEHPGGYRVETRETAVAKALVRLRELWPSGLPISRLFDDVNLVGDDLQLLYRNGLIELRWHEPDAVDPHPLNRLEAQWNGGATTAYHTRVSALATSANGAADATELEPVA